MEPRQVGENPQMAATDPLPGPEAPRKLTRSTTDKYLAGVAGGLGQYFGVDAAVFRLAFGVSVLFGGVGIVAYLALVAFVPTDDGEPAWIEGRSRATTIALIAVLAIAAVSMLSPPTFLLGPGLLVIVGLVAVGAGLYRAFGGARGDDPARVIARLTLVGLVMVAALAAAAGVGFIVALGGGPAIAVVSIFSGFGLIVAGLLGGPRWLILPVMVLVLPLAVVSAADLDVDGGVGELSFRPTSVQDLRSEYRVGLGEMDLDLRALELPPGRTEVRLDVGVGQAIVHVPDGVCVGARGHIGLGEIQGPDRLTDGFGVDYDHPARNVPGRPQLILTADVGLGHVQINQFDSCA
jgi:phage shock protein PspC (stress-responsive transcriptional regulator)